MNQKRPINLDLRTMKFPPMAIASILHRVSGVVLFLLMPVMLYFLAMSIQSPESFANLQNRLANPSYKLVLWAFSAAFIYHLLAGIRHMIMDMGFGEDLRPGRQSAILVIILAIILTLLLGIWIW
ncbi:succinate dehydrogenase, cytochrome b556 subunit [Legionella jordanis]|uniref:Succinate dehydrogenase cytochrome b556 subunit n=1 Tax=Legionella jordanis TaxID=456 RepID=A0A0W0VDG8_9GAMM|nr:succinate dehydrogenase, cytochrome b556 subunit [Legionella jordanis]KTD18171.1 succinate dehydrogenase cytochrome b556 subunit C [Legionella jordanis]RMX01133.1 succinate dehydrogenase, cytochrome b556 subunit [Legionella jordanis]RMX21363.1 succinate dehydrogenase, cytochrome b556 subunit [Legionella jordanis]VEH13736.1 succinate dehydrogenase cytochrome b556 subunit C [Legionella jordanis]HAT8714553.1 succinate dehydrogenase, cytochrome b556 subunit [Legionella jordanis]